MVKVLEILPVLVVMMAMVAVMYATFKEIIKEIIDDDILSVKRKVGKVLKGVKYRKELGKEYWGIIKWLDNYIETELTILGGYYKGQYKRNLQDLKTVIEKYKEDPKNYYLLMDKYFQAISLSKHMLEEAKASEVEKDSKINGQLKELIEEVSIEFKQKEKELKRKAELAKEQEVMVLSGRIAGETKILRGVRKLRGE